MEVAVGWLTEYREVVFGAIGATIDARDWGSLDLESCESRGKAAAELPYSKRGSEFFVFLRNGGTEFLCESLRKHCAT